MEIIILSAIATIIVFFFGGFNINFIVIGWTQI